MKPGFYTIMAAQFFSSLADNALLMAAIALLMQTQSPAWVIPLLKLFFVVSYVVLAPFVGAFADALPKGRVMFVTNAIKVIGCIMMFCGIHPLIAYAVVGFGAAAYSPAKYGILTELLPPEKLVQANGWMEGLTVGSIILGTMLGGALISPDITARMLAFDFPYIDTPVDTPAEAAILVLSMGYVIAGIFNLRIPDTRICYINQTLAPLKLIKIFSRNLQLLWCDKLGQISLAVTTLFWGAGATLQFIVLKWAQAALGMELGRAAILQGICALGVAMGAALAAKIVPLKRSLHVIPIGILMGLITMGMTQVHSKLAAYPLLILIGALSGFFVVPMNALLQHRGHVLMSAGRSIAIQNFNENLSVLVMLGLYAFLIHLDMDVNQVIIIFGGIVTCAMMLVGARHYVNQKQYNIEAHIGEQPLCSGLPIDAEICVKKPGAPSMDSKTELLP